MPDEPVVGVPDITTVLLLKVKLSPVGRPEIVAVRLFPHVELNPPEIFEIGLPS